MKKIIFLVLLMFTTISLVACNEEDIPSELAELTKLKTPVVSISEDGLASWGKVKHATGYLYKINNGKAVETDELEVWLEYGDSIRVKALGDEELYEDSSYSKAVTYERREETVTPTYPPTIPETPLPPTIIDPPVYPTRPDGKVIVTFSTYAETELLYKQVERFNDEHEDIEIQLVPYGHEADIKMVDNVPNEIMSGNALELSNFVYSDYEWDMVNEALRDSVTYNGNIYAIPVNQYFMGFFANNDILKYVNDFDTLNGYDFEQLIRAVYTLENIDGFTALGSTGDMINWLPGLLDESNEIKYFLWNSGTMKIEYTNEAAYKAISYIQELYKLSYEYKLNNSDNLSYWSAYDAFINGAVALYSSGTWEQFYDDNFEFIGLPGNRVLSAVDYMCISSDTSFPSIAYEVAKYLSFGIEGNEDKLDLAEQYGLTHNLNSFPVTEDEYISNRWLDHMPYNGYKNIYQKVVDNEVEIIFEPNKTLPNYVEARFNGSTDIAYDDIRGGSILSIGDYIWEACNGAISLETYKSDINKKLENKLNDPIKNGLEQINGSTVNSVKNISLVLDSNNSDNHRQQEYYIDGNNTVMVGNMTFQKEGYKIVGWSDKYGNILFNGNFEATLYNLKRYVSYDGEELVLYAVWEEIVEDYPTVEPSEDTLNVNSGWYSMDFGVYDINSYSEPWEIYYNKPAGYEWSFLGTSLELNEAVYHNFTIELNMPKGKNFIVKLEGMAGAYEQSFVGSGKKEKYTLDLSHLSEFKNKNYNLLLIFVDYNVSGSVSGNFTIYDAYFSDLVSGGIDKPIEDPYTNIYDGYSEIFSFNSKWQENDSGTYNFSYFEYEGYYQVDYNVGPWQFAYTQIGGDFAKFPYVVFEVEGTFGQRVLFKAEGYDLFCEQWVEFSGGRDFVVLDLSQYSWSQRESIARIIMFADGDIGGYGSFNIYNAYFTMDCPDIPTVEDDVNYYDGVSETFNVNNYWYGLDKRVYKVNSVNGINYVDYNRNEGQQWSALATNVSGKLQGFDKLSFDLVIPYGVRYIVKIETSVGYAKEYIDYGLGSLGHFELDFSDFSNYEKNNINKILIFIDFENYNATSGAYEIHSMKFEKGNNTINKVTYDGTYSGEAIYNEFSGNYEIFLDLNQWGNVTIYLNGSSVDLTTLNIFGLFSGFTGADWTENLYCDYGNSYTLFTCTGGSYVLYYNPNLSSLEISLQEEVQPPYITNVYDGVSETFDVNNYWHGLDQDVYTVSQSGNINYVSYNKSWGQEWSALVTDVSLNNGDFDRLSFSIMSSSPNYIVKVEGDGIYKEQWFAGNGLLQSFELTFYEYSKEQINKINRVLIFMDAGTSPASGIFEIHHVNFEKEKVDNNFEAIVVDRYNAAGWAEVNTWTYLANNLSGDFTVTTTIKHETNNFSGNWWRGILPVIQHEIDSSLGEGSCWVSRFDWWGWCDQWQSNEMLTQKWNGENLFINQDKLCDSYWTNQNGTDVTVKDLEDAMAKSTIIWTCSRIGTIVRNDFTIILEDGRVFTYWTLADDISTEKNLNIVLTCEFARYTVESVQIIQ